MATFFTMPKLGMNMVEGHIVSWLAKEGEPVREG
jgi:pyruvate/2-oxoglutarate dehydrogenase complex dihydrolipoamide acyltransferase (E2) component